MSDERELTADGWPLGVTREQILAELGISRELAAECERLAALSEAEPHCDRLAGIFEGLQDDLAERLRRLSQAPRLFCASTNLLHDLFTSLGQHDSMTALPGRIGDEQ